METFLAVKRWNTREAGGTAQIVDSSGNVIKSQDYGGKGGRLGLPATYEKAADALEKAIKPVFLDMPKWLRGIKGDLSNELAGILSDGVVRWEEKDQIRDTIEKLEDLKIKIGADFDKAGFDKILNDYKNTYLEIKVKLDTGQAEIDFFEWRKEHEALFIQMVGNKVPAMQEEARTQWQWEIDRPGEFGRDLMKSFDDAIASNDPAQLSGIIRYEQQLLDLDPSLKEQKWWTDKQITAQIEYNEHLRMGVNGIVAFDEEGKQVAATTASLDDFLISFGTGIINATGALEDANRRIGAITWPSSATPTIMRPGASDWMPTPTTWGTAKKDAMYTKESLKRALFAATYQEGGITGSEGLAYLHANEIVIPSSVLPCAVSSQYQTLENPDLFRQDTIRSASTGQVWDAHDLGYNIKSVSKDLNDLGGCVSSATHIFQEQNSAALFYQTKGIYSTRTGQQFDQLDSNFKALNTNVETLNVVVPRTTEVYRQNEVAATDVGKSFTWVSDLFWNPDTDDRWKITGETDGLQSSSKRGQVTVIGEEEARKHSKVNPFTGESSWDRYTMDARIFAAQMEAAGKSTVMPGGPHEEPQWAVDASHGVITKQSQGTLNPMAIDRDILRPVAAKVERYADVTDKAFLAELKRVEATTQLTAEQNQYCDATGKMRISLEEEQRTSEKATIYRKSMAGVQSKYYAAMDAYLNQGKTFSEVEALLPGGSSANDRQVQAVKENTKKLDYFGDKFTFMGRKMDALGTTFGQNAASLQKTNDRAMTDLLSANVGPAFKGRLTEFDSWVSSAESGLASCVEYMSDWGLYQEAILAKPASEGGAGFFNETKLGGFEKEYPETLPYENVRNARLGEISQAAGYITIDGVQTALDESSMAKAIAEINRSNQQSVAVNKDTAKSTAKTAIEVHDLKGAVVASTQMQGAALSNLLSGIGGGTGGWGGTGMNGGGGWLGTWGSMGGFNGGTYYGSTAPGAYASSGGHSGWGGAASEAASGGGSGSWGSVQWAGGGIYDQPAYFLDGDGNPNVAFEAGREAFVPISDRAAGLRILPQVMKELGVKQFAKGGFAGKGVSSISETVLSAVGSSTVNLGGIKIYPSPGMDETALANKTAAKVIKALKDAPRGHKRRT